jgi:crossover junction endodeoxyribonuclease RusA
MNRPAARTLACTAARADTSPGADGAGGFPITLPWPPTCLWPNSRTDRRAATGARRMMRDAGFYGAKEAHAVITADAVLAITFHPPTSARRDMDNMLAAIKAGLDGISMATCGDDAGWSLRLSRGAPIKGGRVSITVEQA